MLFKQSSENYLLHGLTGMYSILKVKIDYSCQKNRNNKNYLQKTSQDKMLNREIRISLYVKKLFGMKKQKEW